MKHQLSKKDLAVERKSREIKKISDYDITEAAYKKGRNIATISQDVFLKALMKSLKSHGPVESLAFCNMEAQGITDSLSKNLNVKLRRTSLKVRNSQNEPNEYEKQLLEAYQYNFDNGIKLEDNIQKLPGEHLLYTKPILIGSPKCLNCHGSREEISAEVLTKLKEFYPLDSATGYAGGDFRGMWSITFAQKDVILGME